MKHLFDGEMIEVKEGAMMLCTKNFYMEDRTATSNPIFTKGVIYIAYNISNIDEELISLVDNSNSDHWMGVEEMHIFKWIGTVHPEVIESWLGEEEVVEEEEDNDYALAF